MNLKESIDALIHLLEIIISWQVLILFIGIIFYKEIKNAVPELLKRLKKAPGGWEFDELQEAKADTTE